MWPAPAHPAHAALQVKFIPAQDLKVIDSLWRAASGNKFGYSVQKDIWVQNRRYWERLFKAIDWVQGEYNMYRCATRCSICMFPPAS